MDYEIGIEGEENLQINSFVRNRIYFSVLIPVYNVEKYLGKCIFSVLEQTYHNFEIILINDGSTDDSGLICERYAKIDDRIKVYHQHNEGLIMARRKAISKARGDYYLFLDSDDYWDVDLLETIYKAISDYGCDLVIFNYKKVTPSGAYINEPVFENGTFFEWDNKEQIFDQMIKGSRLNNIWTKAVKRNIVDYVDYSEYKEVKNAEDLLQSLPFINNARRILYIDKPMYNYRMNPASITHKFRIRFINDITMVREVVLKYIEIRKMDDANHLKSFYQYYFTGVLSYITDLNISNTPYAEKKKIMDQIQDITLFKNSLPYLEGSDLRGIRRIQSYLLKKKHYRLLTLYVRTVHCMKHIIYHKHKKV